MTLTIKPSKLSHWAAKNIRFAVGLIVLIEFVKFGIGYYLGKNALPALPFIAINSMAGFIAISVFFVQKNLSGNTQKLSYSLIAKGNFVLFTASFLLSILAGNQRYRLENPAENSNISAAYSEEIQQNVNGDSLLTKIKAEQLAISKNQQFDEDERMKNDKRRIGYFFLFLLAMGLTVLAFGLACGLACGGYGVLAVIAFLLNLGILGSGIYFLLKVFQKDKIKKWKEMDNNERKKERKRYLKTLFTVIGTIAVFFLITSLINS